MLLTASRGGERVRRRKRRGQADWRRSVYDALWASTTGEAAPDSGRARLARIARHHLFPALAYGLIAAVMTYPLVRGFDRAIVGNNYDAWQNLWNFWWARVALEEGRWPFRTPYLYAPEGAPLYLHTHNLFNGLVGLPAQLAGNLAAAYNTVVIVAFVLAAYFAYLLVAYVSGSRWAGFVGGICYGFSAYHLEHLFLGQTNLLASQWLPAYVLCLLRATDATGRRRTGWVAAAAIALLLIMLCDWHYVVFAALLTVLWALVAAWVRRSPVPLAVALAIGALWLIGAAPVLLPTLAALREGVETAVPTSYLAEHSADLLSFVAPGARQRWWLALAPRLGDLAGLRAYAGAASLGYVPLICAAIGMAVARRRAAFWALAALLGLLLALGPALRVAGRERFGPAGWTIPLPYELLQAIPGLGIARVPSRYSLIATIAVAVLAGFGVASLGQRLARRWGDRTRAALALLVGAAILAEQAAMPFPAQPVEPPAFARYLAAQPEGGAVLVLPFSLEEPWPLYWQTTHRRPMVGGYLSRRIDDPLLLLPPFSDLMQRQALPDILAPGPPDLARHALGFAGVRWVIVDLSHARFDREPLASFMARQVEPAPVYTDQRFAVYRALRPEAATRPPVAARVGTGWYDPEPLTGTSGRMRWLEGTGTIHLWNLGATPDEATIELDAWSFQRARRLEISLDGEVVGLWEIGDWQRIRLPLALDPGRHRLELRAHGAPIRPSEAGAGPDTRPLTIAVAGVELRP